MPINRANIRTTRHLQDTSSDSDTSDKEEVDNKPVSTVTSSTHSEPALAAPPTPATLVSAVKQMQKLRERHHGLSAEELALGTSARRHAKVKRQDSDGLDGEEGSKKKMGGLLNTSNPDLEDVEAILLGRNFAHETNKRDEDKEMLKFIEKELSKRRGEDVDDETSPSKKGKLHRNDVLTEAVPELLRPTLSQRNTKEGMLSQQMLSGIPEVDLGLEAKMRNIIATEDAKQRLLEQQRIQQQLQIQKDQASHLLLQALSGQLNAKNSVSLAGELAAGSGDTPLGTVDYVQHKRWREPFQRVAHEAGSAPKSTVVSSVAEPAPGPVEPVSSAELHRLETAKSTDLLHLKKFKEHEMRRKHVRRK